MGIIVADALSRVLETIESGTGRMGDGGYLSLSCSKSYAYAGERGEAAINNTSVPLLRRRG
jgi:hypothetical protein